MTKSKKKKLKTAYKWTASRLKIIIKLVVILVLLAVIVGGGYFYYKYGKDILDSQQMAKECVGASTTDTFKQNQTSIVYDSSGEVISTVKGDKDSYYLSYEDIPSYAKDAIVTCEDRTFYEHDGLDYKANLAAVISLIENKGEIKRGGSTITQQLARNIFLSHEVTWKRKVHEIFIAQELEKKYDKYQILEFYFNNIYFANGYYGIQAAAKGYFDRAVSELSLGEITFLCAIPNNPTIYDPLTEFENTVDRKNRILEQMLEFEKITQEEYEEALNQKIVLNMTKKVKNDYVETYVYYCATRALMAKAGFVFKNDFDTEAQKVIYDEEYNEMYNQCQQMLFSKGYRIYTSIDMEKQAYLQECVDKGLEGFTELKDNGIYALQGSAACIDNETGRVVAIVGGRKQDTVGYTLNRAFQSYRQPGSAIKPILLFAPAFEAGYVPDTKVVDEEIEDGPKNAGGGYLGQITMRKALEQSVNTVAWKLFGELTPDKCLGYLVRMDFSKITYKDNYMAASLGGTTYGASAVEMAASYATLENDGIYNTPTCIVKIMNAQGEEVVTNPSSKKEVYERNSARMSTDILKGVLTTGTAKGYALPGVDSAGKTGTTDNKKDGWFVGYTPYYTTAVWVGYDMPRAMEDLKGNTYPLYIWYEYMKGIHKGLSGKKFEPYEEVEPSVEDEATKRPIPSKRPDMSDKPAGSDEPSVSDKPVKSDRPVVSEKPVKTRKPVESENPEKTEKPKDTIVPERTPYPLPTRKPVATDTPQSTIEPQTTDVPQATQLPQVTEAPQITQPAQPTEVPQSTKEPQPTEVPQSTKEPQLTQLPQATDTPQVTQLPESTKEPQASRMPEDEEAPKPAGLL